METNVIISIALIIITIVLGFFLYQYYNKEIVNILEKYQDGEQKKVKIYKRKNEKDYLLKYYYLDGTLNKETKIVNHKREGKSITYFKNGNIYIIDYYDNDVLKHSDIYDINGNFQEKITK